MHPKLPFICPECGADVVGDSLYLSKAMPPDFSNPWSGVLHEVTCGTCRWTIPAHLAYRWNMTLEEAQLEWQEIYRATSPNPPG